jgi:hypothetical protein
MIAQITQKHRHTLESLADNCGIDYNAVAPYFYQQTGDIPITRGIHKNAKYRGKVYCYVNHWHDKRGRIYPRITFGTHKHGGYREVFDGYRESQNDFDYSISPEREVLKPIPISPAKNKREKWQIDNFNLAAKLFATATDDVSEHPYILAKQLPTEGLDIRRCVGRFGDCVMTKMQTIDGGIIGYQAIYDKPFDGKRNKEFIGVTARGFEIIGGTIQDVIERGAWFAEGVSTCLAVFHARGSGDELSNDDNLPVVICYSAGQLNNVIDDFVAAGMDGEAARLAADNDCGKDYGNTGLFNALLASKKHGADIYLPRRKNAAVTGEFEAVDFADTLEHSKFDAPKNNFEYRQWLINHAPVAEINRRIGKDFANDVARLVPSQMSVNDAIKFVNAALAKRGADLKRIRADRIIKNVDLKRKTTLKKIHTITQKLGVNRIKFDANEGNETIAKFIVEAGEGIFLDPRGLGAGKTKLLEILRQMFRSEFVAYICHRISLTKDAANRLHLDHYQDDDLIGSNGVAFCVNSILKHKGFTVLFLDEFRQLLEHVTKGSVENRQAILNELIRAIKAADLVICSDADLNDRCVEFLRKHANGKSINLIEVEAPANPKVIKTFNGFDALRVDMLEQIQRGYPVMVACTSREVAEQNELFLTENGIAYDSILTVHSKKVERLEAQDAFLSNPNQHATKYLVINHSPSIGSGVSIEVPHFAVNYLFDSGNLTANEKLQMLARNRMTNDWRVAFGTQKIYDRVTNFSLLSEGEGKKAAYYVKETQEYGKTTWEANELGQLRIDLEVERNDDLNDFANNLIALAEIKGITIDYSVVNIEVEKVKGLATRVKETRIKHIMEAAAIDDKTAATIKNSAAKKARSHELDRHLTTIITGKLHADIDTDDVARVHYGKAIEQVTNREILNAKVADLKNWDIQNALTQDRTICKMSVHKLGNTVIKRLTKTERIDKKVAQKVCDYLFENSAEVAANNLGNFTYKTKNPLRKLGEFVKYFGYELSELERKGSGGSKGRIFELKPIDYISDYVNNREALKRF